jgi:peroxiredoxin
MFLTACGAAQRTPESAEAVVVVVGEVSATATSAPRPSATPLNTPRPNPTTQATATPVEVIVTRLDAYTDIEPGEPLEVGDQVPDIELTTTDGTVYALRDLEGRPLLINFWTLGCGSCFFEFPEMQVMYEEVGQELGFLPIGINVSESPQQAAAVGEALGATFPVVVDPGGAVFATAFGGRFVPTNYFVTPDGIVSEVIIGPLDRKAIQRALDEMILS